MANLTVTISGNVPSSEWHIDMFAYDLSFAQAVYPGSFLPGFSGVTDLISLLDAASEKAVELRGDDLSFTAGAYNGHVHTINLFSYFNTSAGNTFTVASLTGFSIDITTVTAVIGTPSTSDDLDLLRDLLSGNDEIRLSAGDDAAFGWRGNDSLFGMGGDDDLYGDNGNDTLEGGEGSDALVGGNGRDTASYAGAASGVTVALDGSVQGTGDAAGDIFLSIENVTGSGFGDSITGDVRTNVLSGGKGNDIIRGMGGVDSLMGDAGRDIFYGGRGADIIDLGTGIDRVVFESRKEGGDVVSGFSADDQFLLVQSAFGNLDLGVIDDAVFVSGNTNAAGDAGDRFIFRTTDSSLWFDPDGTGTVAPIMMAQLQTAYLLASDQIIIIG
ncbi:MAG: hypothetical protein KDJ29_21595 [Hyphomicrobiales bacterium]|nr:hypothetical protein [Hyphomicrobiales bacterium]